MKIKKKKNISKNFIRLMVTDIKISMIAFPSLPPIIFKINRKKQLINTIIKTPIFKIRSSNIIVRFCNKSGIMIIMMDKKAKKNALLETYRLLRSCKVQ